MSFRGEKLIAGTVAALALTLGGCATTSANAEKPPTGTSQTDKSPSPEATPTAKSTEIDAAGWKLSPNYLAGLDETGLIDAYKITGSTPDELATSAQRSLEAMAMSGASETLAKQILDPMRDSTGQIGLNEVTAYGVAIAARNCKAAGEAWAGPGHIASEDICTLAKITAEAYAFNRKMGADKISGQDFSINPDQIVSGSVKVTDGEFGKGTFTLVYNTRSSSNYSDSQIAKSGGQHFGSLQNWSGIREITTVFSSNGPGKFTVVSSTSEKVNES